MLVKMLASFSGPDADWQTGSEQNLPTDEATRLIDAGFAVPVSAPKVERAIAKPVAEKR